MSYVKKYQLFQNVDFLGGKSVNRPIHSLGVGYIRMKLSGIGNCIIKSSSYEESKL